MVLTLTNWIQFVEGINRLIVLAHNPWVISLVTNHHAHRCSSSCARGMVARPCWYGAAVGKVLAEGKVNGAVGILGLDEAGALCCVTNSNLPVWWPERRGRRVPWLLLQLTKHALFPVGALGAARTGLDR